MYRQIVWSIFVGVVALFTVWYVVKAAADVYHYTQLNQQIEVVIEKWSIEELKADHFAVIASYFFEYRGKNYKGGREVGPTYPNPWAAQGAQKRFSQQSWSAWFNQKHPEYSVLEKHFPVKTALSATILIFLLLYFVVFSFFL